jgi:DNA-binding XRE family transcriptional regulator
VSEPLDPLAPLVGKLVELRIRHDITRREVAEALGVHYKTIRNWEVGRCLPWDWRLVVAWAAVLGYELELGYRLKRFS